MKCIVHKTLQFIYSKRKQILFALFAFICNLLDNNSDVLMCAAPAVVAGAAAAASGTGAAAGGAAATGAATAAGTGAATSGSAAAAGTASTAGTTGASAGAVSNAANVSSGATTASNAANMPNTGSMNVRNTDVPKNTNPKGTHSNTLSSNSVSSEINKPAEGFTDATDKGVKKDASMSDVDKETKNSKKNRMSPDITSSEEDEEENQIDLENASRELTKDSSGMVVGCVFTSIFLFVFSIPILVLLLINPTSSVMSQIDCSVYDGINCVEDDSGNFGNKLKNLFMFGSFSSNSEVVTKTITDVHEKLLEEGFTVNLPLLSSSLFSDSEYSKSEVNEENEFSITDEMLERLEYVEDLARMQMIEDYVVYTCRVKEVNGVNAYYKETNYDNIDPETVSEGDCDSSTVGMILKEKSFMFNEDEYFKRLEESEILDLIYSDYMESDTILVSKIKTQYYLFNSLNLINTENDEYDLIPLSLMYDANVNLSAPLKGWVYITSPFGMRDGEFAGMHKGIDLVANDKNIYAAGNGVVTRSNVELEGGNVIEITHTTSDGVEYITQYAHLSQRLVSVGDVVNTGDIIGVMGDTGTLASGVHLHFQMWLKEPYELLNPKNLFSNASNY